jgi:hypothetical protein
MPSISPGWRLRNPNGCRTRSDRISPAPTAFHASVAKQLGLGNLDRAAVALDLILRHPQRGTPFSPLVELRRDLLMSFATSHLNLRCASSPGLRRRRRNDAFLLSLFVALTPQLVPLLFNSLLAVELQLFLLWSKSVLAIET